MERPPSTILQDFSVMKGKRSLFSIAGRGKARSDAFGRPTDHSLRIEVYHADPLYEASGRFQLSQLQDD